MLRVPIKANMVFKEANTDQQICVYCGKFLRKGEPAISMNNKGDKLVIRKNLWIHAPCVTLFAEKVRKILSSPDTLARLI